MFHSQESEEKTSDNENYFESRLKKNFENCEEKDKVTVSNSEGVPFTQGLGLPLGPREGLLGALGVPIGPGPMGA